MGPRRADRAVDYERRHRADSELAGHPLIAADLVGEPVGSERLTNLVLVEADLDRQPDERVAIGHQLAFGEVGVEQPLLHRVLEPVLGGEVDDAVAVEGRTAALDVEPEVEPLAGSRVGHRALHLLGSLDRDAVLLGQAARAVALALARRRGVELEAPPRHPDVVSMLELGERGLEAALADVAPGAGDVRPDFDVHGNAPQRKLISQGV